MNIYSTLLKFFGFYATYILFKTTHEYSWVVWIPWVFLVHTVRREKQTPQRNRASLSLSAACGITAGIFRSAEAAITIGCEYHPHNPFSFQTDRWRSYPEAYKRGWYLVYWLAYRNIWVSFSSLGKGLLAWTGEWLNPRRNYQPSPQCVPSILSISKRW